MSPDVVRAAAAELIERTRVARGLPPQIEDVALLTRLAALVAPRPAASHSEPAAHHNRRLAKEIVSRAIDLPSSG